MLRRCLESVQQQGYPLVEHIVVDGGSQPSVAALLEQAGVAFVSERDSGQANAIKKGFAMARGDLLGWLNADDVLLPDAVHASLRRCTSIPPPAGPTGIASTSEDERRASGRHIRT